MLQFRLSISKLELFSLLCVDLYAVIARGGTPGRHLPGRAEPRSSGSFYLFFKLQAHHLFVWDKNYDLLYISFGTAGVIYLLFLFYFFERICM